MTFSFSATTVLATRTSKTPFTVPDGLPAFFAFRHSILTADVQGVEKNLRGRIEADAMLLQIASVPRLVPGKSHLYKQYCLYETGTNAAESFRFRRPLERSNNGWAGGPLSNLLLKCPTAETADHEAHPLTQLDTKGTYMRTQLMRRIRKRSGSAGSRSTTWIGGQAHCQTLLPGVRENWISPRVPSTATRGQDSAMRSRSTP